MSNRDLSAAEVPRLLRKGELRIVVVGLGRIGLPTAALFAKAGAHVTGVDVAENVVNKTNEGKCHLVDEPGLAEVVEESVKAGNLRATLMPKKAISEAHFIIVCVPTPVDETKTPNYTAVKKASRTIGESLGNRSVVIIESTIGPGVVEGMVLPILESSSGLKVGRDFGLASCPERSDPGNIVQNMYSVPRIVGGMDRETTEAVASLYESALGVKTMKMSDPRTANAVKLTENLFRDVNIALANEFALLYEKLGVDAIEVINACASKYNFMPHYPGTGVGGPCLPANSYYLISEGMRAGNIPYMIRLAREINDRMPDHVVELVGAALNEAGKTINGSRIAVLGVAYKPNVRDVQLTPVERVVTRLKEMGANLELYDPMFKGEQVFGFPVRSTLEKAATGADCVVIGTAHTEFKHLDIAKLSTLMKGHAALVDSRQVVPPEKAIEAGFAFRGVGRK